MELDHFDKLYPGRFMKAGHLGDKRWPFTIAAVQQEELEGEKGKELKVTLSFERTTQQIVLCKLNATCIKEMFGPRVPEWIGKRIVLYATNTIMPMPRPRGDTRPPEACIRVYGSPDIAADVSFEWAPPRRKKMLLTMRAVRKATAQDAPSAPQTPQPSDTPPATESAAQGPVCPGCGASVADLDEAAREYVATAGTCPRCG